MPADNHLAALAKLAAAPNTAFDPVRDLVRMLELAGSRSNPVRSAGDGHGDRPRRDQAARPLGRGD